MSDSATAKLLVVVGIGAVVLGGATLRSRWADHPKGTPPQTVSTAQTTQAPVPVAEERPAAPAPATKPSVTQADRIALLEAATAGDQGKVEALFGKGVNLDGTLENAAKSGNAGLVGWLVAHGVSAQEDEDLSVPPLLAADDHDAVVSLLLAKGAHEPTLAKAVAAGAPKAVARLLAKGASAGAKSPEGEPVLMIALRDTAGPKRHAIVESLLKAGADVNLKYDDETPLSLAVSDAALHAATEEKAGDRPVDLVTRLVAAHAKVDADVLVNALATEEERRGALLDTLLSGTLDRAATARAVAAAADRHDAASIKRLATKGVTWSALDPQVSPPLATAIVASDVPMVRALLDAGAPTDKLGENGDSALLSAVAAAAGESDDALRVVRVLLEHGASPNKRGLDGRTALFAAAQQGSETLVALLVAKGARVDDAVDGMTPYEIADSRGYDAVTKVLKARGAKVKKAHD
jgi:ankyrin repeat protein